MSFHRESFKNWIISIAWPFLVSTIYSELWFRKPIAMACFLPSAITATGLSWAQPLQIVPPSLVRPGAMTWLPEKMCLIAPLSQIIWFIIIGNLWSVLSMGRIPLGCNFSSSPIRSFISINTISSSILINQYEFSPLNFSVKTFAFLGQSSSI